jgi:hypothetical protein
MPSSLIAVAVLAAALVPGYAHHRVFQRYAVRDERSPTVEIVELFLAGALSTTIALLLVLAAAQGFPTILVPLRDLAAGSSFLRAHPWQAVTVAILTLTACGVPELGHRC